MKCVVRAATQLGEAASAALATAALATGALHVARGDDLDALDTSPLRAADVRSGAGDGNVPYAAKATSYDPAAAAAFFGARPLAVAGRALTLTQLTAGFNLKLLVDWQRGTLAQNEAERAKEALALVEQLGPTFIKLGQALSIRTDLIPEAYALELRSLQDAVPPFDDRVARRILARELSIAERGGGGGGGGDTLRFPVSPSEAALPGDAETERILKRTFAELSPRPLASASIGQVYKGTLTDGRVVAVKVQRPSVLREISLDLFILRAITPLQVRVATH